MIDLAQNRHDGKIPLRDISKRQDISIKYLEQIVAPLTHSGLIKSVRGAQGGYSLLKELSQYKIKDISEALEGPIACVSCLQTPVNLCPRYQECKTVTFYEGLNQVIIDYLNSYTLEDLIQSNNNIDYVI